LIGDVVTDGPDGVPRELREAIARDLKPVAPLAPPVVRAIGVVPLAILLLTGAVIVFGLRADAIRLGVVLTWGVSALQMTLGLILVAASLREAVPGTTLSRRALGAVFGTALIAVLTITWTTWSVSPTRIQPGYVGFVWRVCVAGTILSALPALAVSGWLVARAFPLRPRLAGAIYGLGAGLMADAGWRLFCHFSDPAHVIGAHVLAVAVTCLIGVALAHITASGRHG
jgi:hypothetical protein